MLLRDELILVLLGHVLMKVLRNMFFLGFSLFGLNYPLTQIKELLKRKNVAPEKHMPFKGMTHNLATQKLLSVTFNPESILKLTD